MQPSIELNYKSLIPRDRVFVNGQESNCHVNVYWSIWDVNNYQMRFSNLFSVTHPFIQDASEWNFRKEGSGLVPLKVFLNESEKTAKVIF